MTADEREPVDVLRERIARAGGDPDAIGSALDWAASAIKELADDIGAQAAETAAEAWDYEAMRFWRIAALAKVAYAAAGLARAPGEG